MAIPSETDYGKKVLFLVETRYSKNENAREPVDVVKKKHRQCAAVTKKLAPQLPPLDWIFVYAAFRNIEIEPVDGDPDINKVFRERVSLALPKNAIVLDQTAIKEAYGPSFNSRVM